uniref:Secreted protein n=1 Tax=Rhizophora mucronata TaxID=61149 RepID=A0A2P2NZX7_RHIMU
MHLNWLCALACVMLYMGFDHKDMDVQPSQCIKKCVVLCEVSVTYSIHSKGFILKGETLWEYFVIKLSYFSNIFEAKFGGKILCLFLHQIILRC